jgi:microcystin-dependent protein
MSTPFLGMIIIVPYNFAPKGWAFCDGQLIAITQNTALFSLLGTTYGGNGQTTFALPDLRGRVPIHVGQGPGLSPFLLGQTGGIESVTLTTNQMPIHTHAITLGTLAAAANVKTGPGNAQSPVGNVLAGEAAGVTATYGSAAPDALMRAGAVSLTGTPTAANAGGGQPFDNHQPYLTFSFVIALQGIFPSRN